MQIEKHKVVTIEYTLKDNEGEVIDTSEGGEPLAYIQGVGSLIEGVETALEGKSTGDQLQITVPPDRGYGERDEELVDTVAREAFKEIEDLEVGMRIRAQTDGGERVVVVSSIDGDQVTVDANHPLAGMELSFDLKVVGVRDATQEEVDHGHVHGPEGHQH